MGGPGTGSGSHLGSNSGQSGQGSLGSHSSHDVNYMNIYQNTNHPHLYDCNLEGSPRHSLGSNNSSNLSTPPSPVREMGSSSYESWIVKEKFYVATDEANISRAEVFRAGKEGYLDNRWEWGAEWGHFSRFVTLLSDCEAFILKFNLI